MNDIDKPPNPGSREAISQGCICPVMDNHYGRRVPVEGGPLFYITEGCPLHWKNVGEPETAGKIDQTKRKISTKESK